MVLLEGAAIRVVCVKEEDKITTQGNKRWRINHQHHRAIEVKGRIINSSWKWNQAKGDFSFASPVVCKAGHFWSSCSCLLFQVWVVFFFFSPYFFCLYLFHSTYILSLVAREDSREGCSPTSRFIPLATQRCTAICLLAQAPIWGRRESELL